MNTTALFDVLLGELERLGLTEPPHDPLGIVGGCLVVRAPLPAELRRQVDERAAELGQELVKRLWRARLNPGTG